MRDAGSGWKRRQSVTAGWMATSLVRALTERSLDGWCGADTFSPSVNFKLAPR